MQVSALLVSACLAIAASPAAGGCVLGIFGSCSNDQAHSAGGSPQSQPAKGEKQQEAHPADQPTEAERHQDHKRQSEARSSKTHSAGSHSELRGGAASPQSAVQPPQAEGSSRDALRQQAEAARPGETHLAAGGREESGGDSAREETRQAQKGGREQQKEATSRAERDGRNARPAEAGHKSEERTVAGGAASHPRPIHEGRYARAQRKVEEVETKVTDLQKASATGPAQVTEQLLQQLSHYEETAHAELREEISRLGAQFDGNYTLALQAVNSSRSETGEYVEHQRRVSQRALASMEHLDKALKRAERKRAHAVDDEVDRLADVGRAKARHMESEVDHLDRKVRSRVDSFDDVARRAHHERGDSADELDRRADKTVDELVDEARHLARHAEERLREAGKIAGRHIQDEPQETRKKKMRAASLAFSELRLAGQPVASSPPSLAAAAALAAGLAGGLATWAAAACRRRPKGLEERLLLQA